MWQPLATGRYSFYGACGVFFHLDKSHFLSKSREKCLFCSRSVLARLSTTLGQRCHVCAVVSSLSCCRVCCVVGLCATTGNGSRRPRPALRRTGVVSSRKRKRLQPISRRCVYSSRKAAVFGSVRGSRLRVYCTSPTFRVFRHRRYLSAYLMRIFELLSFLRL